MSRSATGEPSAEITIDELREIGIAACGLGAAGTKKPRPVCARTGRGPWKYALMNMRRALPF